MRLEWKGLLIAEGFEAIHWRDVGHRQAEDSEIIRWATQHDHVVITQDLDFSAALALLKLDRPSVVILRTRKNKLQASVRDVSWLLKQYTFDLEEGALLIDPDHHRIRKLPLN